MGQYDTAHQAAAMYDSCVDAEIKWLRLKYQRAREHALERSLEQGLLYRVDETDDGDVSPRTESTKTAEPNGPLFGYNSDSDSDTSSGDTSTLTMGSTEQFQSASSSPNSNGSRAWDEAGIDRAIRNYGEIEAGESKLTLSAVAAAAAASSVNKMELGSRKASWHTRKTKKSTKSLKKASKKRATPPGTPPAIRRRNLRRSQFAQNKSRLTNAFEETAPVRIAASPPETKTSRNGSGNGSGEVSVAVPTKQQKKTTKDKNYTAGKAKQQKHPSESKDQYMYLQNLRSNALRMRNFVPPSHPLYVS